MKCSSISRLVSSNRARTGLFGVAVTIGLVVGCGDDDDGRSNPNDEADAAAATGDTASSGSVGTNDTEQPSDASNTNAEDTSGETVAPGSGDAGDDSGSQGNPDDCGGAGEACCADMACSGGFVCIALDVGVDGGGVADGGDLVEAGSISLPSVPAGICAPCGGDGEVCCEENVCNEGFTCETLPSLLEINACVAIPVSTSDAGTDAATGESCGGEGQNCCEGGPRNNGACEDGLECDNPLGPNLADSECVQPGNASTGDSGTDCGALGGPCCQGRGASGICNGDLECEGNPPRGLEGDVCVAP